MNGLHFKKFCEIDRNDVFFDSLKEDYSEFGVWFAKKSDAGEEAYVFYNSRKRMDGFLYLKMETTSDATITPKLPPGKALKVGTLKINAHGTKLGERFIKKIFDHAMSFSASYIYVTVFEKHEGLINLMKRYGFKTFAKKITTNGIEQVFVRKLNVVTGDVVKDFPQFETTDKKYYLLAIYPKYHSAFLPDSILNGENHDILEDVSHTNSIHKVYISGISRTKCLEQGDIVAIYRTNDGKGKAYYRSVVSSLGVVEEVRQIKSFKNESQFIKYAKPYSIFTIEQLKEYFTSKQKSYIIKFTYNAALRKRIIRKRLIEECMISTRARWDFTRLTEAQLKWIADEGEINESLIVNKA
ncbi:N-acetyltransferase [Pseudomonas syringae]|uniref:N-acetyltransferase n=1 Tax=Pseudomonas syringae TaxID=317 RepID=UPI001BD11F71|nr:N-acetyltransferase [Pseudomonas syringae]MBS7435856.1 N-acetyltransferase [Pseudomonas syringae]MBS7460649.1 N-acetyltransferase [Pseudomonas syringae]